MKDIKVFLKKKKKKDQYDGDNMIANYTKIYQKMKNKSLLSVEKDIVE